MGEAGGIIWSTTLIIRTLRPNANVAFFQCDIILFYQKQNKDKLPTVVFVFRQTLAKVI